MAPTLYSIYVCFFFLAAHVEHPTECPTGGDYNFVDQTSECNGQFMIGCRTKKEIEIVKRCPVNRQSGEY